MPQIEIPKEWGIRVCEILETEATDRLIEWKKDAELRFDADAEAAKIRLGESSTNMALRSVRPDS